MVYSARQEPVSIPTEQAEGPVVEWFEAMPREAAEWAGEYISADLEETARRLRRHADFLEGKARLLRNMMASVAKALPEATPTPTQAQDGYEAATAAECAQEKPND